MLPLHWRQLLERRHCLDGSILQLSWRLEFSLDRSKSSIVRVCSRAALGLTPGGGGEEIVVEPLGSMIEWGGK